MFIIFFLKKFQSLLKFCTSYQSIFTILGYVYSLLYWYKPYKETKNRHKYCIIIYCQNGEKNIENCVNELMSLDYPADKYKIYVLLHNSMDNTKSILSKYKNNIEIIEYYSDIYINKGSALNYFFTLKEVVDEYEGFCIFGWYLRKINKDYLLRMNEAFDYGEKIIYPQRLFLNIFENYVTYNNSTEYSLKPYFEFRGRSLLGLNCFLRMDGVLIQKELALKYSYNTYDERFELVIFANLDGHKVTYCDSAKIYLNSHNKFIDEFNERAYTVNGKLQLFKYDYKKLYAKFKTALSKVNFFKLFDLFFYIMYSPCIKFIIENIIFIIICLHSICQNGFSDTAYLIMIQWLKFYTYLWARNMCNDFLIVLAFYRDPMFRKGYTTKELSIKLLKCAILSPILDVSYSFMKMKGTFMQDYKRNNLALLKKD